MPVKYNKACVDKLKTRIRLKGKDEVQAGDGLHARAEGGASIWIAVDVSCRGSGGAVLTHTETVTVLNDMAVMAPVVPAGCPALLA